MGISKILKTRGSYKLTVSVATSLLTLNASWRLGIAGVVIAELTFDTKLKRVIVRVIVHSIRAKSVIK